jgi:galactose mutarotase-like enzyme
MVNFKIENDSLSAEIRDMGAELHSLKSQKSGVEYLWQGNPAIWSGQSPILFPIIGQLLNSSFVHEGIEYHLPKHGFARESIFQNTKHEKSCAEFILKSNENSIAVFPFQFELYINFELNGNRLITRHIVVNKGDHEMYFSIGAHPGFNCMIGDYLEFEKNETLLTERIDETAIIIDEKIKLLEDARKIELTADLFANDALFLSGYKSSQIKLKSPRHNRELCFVFGNAPFLGIWAKPAAPYVCIEPWYGINDNYHQVKDISQKRGIQMLSPDGTFSFSWSAEISEPD